MMSRRWGPVLEDGLQDTQQGLTEQTSVQNAGKMGSLLPVPPDAAGGCASPEHSHMHKTLPLDTYDGVYSNSS